jgi:hypothetical protein
LKDFRHFFYPTLTRKYYREIASDPRQFLTPKSPILRAGDIMNGGLLGGDAGDDTGRI